MLAQIKSNQICLMRNGPIPWFNIAISCHLKKGSKNLPIPPTSQRALIEDLCSSEKSISRVDLSSPPDEKRLRLQFNVEQSLNHDSTEVSFSLSQSLEKKKSRILWKCFNEKALINIPFSKGGGSAFDRQKKTLFQTVHSRKCNSKMVATT